MLGSSLCLSLSPGRLHPLSSALVGFASMWAGGLFCPQDLELATQLPNTPGFAPPAFPAALARRLWGMLTEVGRSLPGPLPLGFLHASNHVLF